MKPDDLAPALTLAAEQSVAEDGVDVAGERGVSEKHGAPS